MKKIYSFNSTIWHRILPCFWDVSEQDSSLYLICFILQISILERSLSLFLKPYFLNCKSDL